MVVVQSNAANGLVAVRLSWLEVFARRLDPECLTYEVVTALDATRDQDIVVDPYDPNHAFVPEDID